MPAAPMYTPVKVPQLSTADAGVYREHTRLLRALLKRCNEEAGVGLEWRHFENICADYFDSDKCPNPAVAKRFLERGILQLMTDILGDERITIVDADDLMRYDQGLVCFALDDAKTLGALWLRAQRHLGRIIMAFGHFPRVFDAPAKRKYTSVLQELVRAHNSAFLRMEFRCNTKDAYPMLIHGCQSCIGLCLGVSVNDKYGHMVPLELCLPVLHRAGENLASIDWSVTYPPTLNEVESMLLNSCFDVICKIINWLSPGESDPVELPQNMTELIGMTVDQLGAALRWALFSGSSQSTSRSFAVLTMHSLLACGYIYQVLPYFIEHKICAPPIAEIREAFNDPEKLTAIPVWQVCSLKYWTELLKAIHSDDFIKHFLDEGILRTLGQWTIRDEMTIQGNSVAYLVLAEIRDFMMAFIEIMPEDGPTRDTFDDQMAVLIRDILLDQKKPAVTSVMWSNVFRSAREDYPLVCDVIGCAKTESESGALLQCTRCKSSKYCSRSCQKLDWKMRHKLRCGITKEAV